MILLEDRDIFRSNTDVLIKSRENELLCLAVFLLQYTFEKLCVCPLPPKSGKFKLYNFKYLSQRRESVGLTS